MDPNNTRMREYIYSLITLKPSITVLDLGCGQGYDLHQISQHTDQDSKLIGLDSIESSIVKANENYEHDPRMEFISHNFAKDIPFDDNSFDLVFSNWNSQLIDGDNKALIRTITQTFNDWKQDWMDDIDSWMGRRLWRTFQESGLFTMYIYVGVKS